MFFKKIFGYFGVKLNENLGVDRMYVGFFKLIGFLVDVIQEFIINFVI